VETPAYRCWTKATNAELGPPRRSAHWLVARRDWFCVFQDRIECGDWIIRREDVGEAVLYRTRSLFMPVSVLSVLTGKETFQFGFNPWVRIRDRLPFDVREERVTMRHSAFSLVTRGVICAYLLFLAARWWLSR